MLQSLTNMNCWVYARSYTWKVVEISSDGWGCSAAWEENSWMVQLSALTQSASHCRQMLVGLVPAAWQSCAVVGF